MKKLILALVFTLLLMPVVVAQSGEQITEFTSDIVVSEDASVRITEQITYDFGSNERRGIFRDIPTQYIVEGDQGYEVAASVLSVQRNNVGETFIIIKENDAITRIRIGEPDKFISGQHTYQIIYELEPVVVKADNGNAILRLDIPGDLTEVPTQLATARVTGLPYLRATCYEGETGVTNQTCEVTERGDQLLFSSSRPLNPNETMTIEVEYNPGQFSRFAEQVTINLSSNASPSIIAWFMAGLGLLTIVPILKSILAHHRYKRRRKQEIVYPRYEPPTDLGPAELGLLLDNSSNGAEFSATLIDLAVRGYIKIIQTKEKKWFSTAQYDLQKLRGPGDDMRSYERAIFDVVFADAAERVSVPSLSKDTRFLRALRKFHKRLKNNLSELGFYKPVDVFASDLASRMTDDGYTKWAEIEGFRDFLQMTEADRLAFHDAPEKKPEEFSALLPYAVAMGVEKQWAEQFKDLDVRVDEWYEGRSTGMAPITTRDLSAMSSGLSAIAATSNSSSGSSSFGGGSSGGGFGGGGTGSW